MEIIIQNSMTVIDKSKLLMAVIYVLLDKLLPPLINLII